MSAARPLLILGIKLVLTLLHSNTHRNIVIKDNWSALKLYERTLTQTNYSLGIKHASCTSFAKHIRTESIDVLQFHFAHSLTEIMMMMISTATDAILEQRFLERHKALLLQNSGHSVACLVSTGGAH